MKRNAIAIARSLPNPELERAFSTLMWTLSVYFLLIAIAVAACSFPSGSNTPMGFVLCEVVWFMYGNMGRGLATLAVTIIGVGAMLGKVSWGMAITVGVGISVMFNAEEITSWLVCGNGSETICF